MTSNETFEPLVQPLCTRARHQLQQWRMMWSSTYVGNKIVPKSNENRTRNNLTRACIVSHLLADDTPLLVEPAPATDDAGDKTT